MATFIAICEGYLQIPPHFNLWRHFFGVQLLGPTSTRGILGTPFQLGCASIHLRGERADSFFRMRVQTSNKGWHRRWFYLKNDTNHGVPEFDNQVFFTRPESWRSGAPPAELQRMEPLFRTILRLKEAGVTGVGATGAYHARGVAPLMRRSLPLDAMVEGADLGGTVLRGGAPSNFVILTRLRDAFADPPGAYPIEGHPPMHPAPGSVQVMRILFL